MSAVLMDDARWEPVEGFDLDDVTYHRAIDGGTVRVAFDRRAVRNAFRPGTVDDLHADMADAAVGGLEDEEWGRGRRRAGDDHLRDGGPRSGPHWEHCREHPDPAAVPKLVEDLDAHPRIASDTVDWTALRGRLREARRRGGL